MPSKSSRYVAEIDTADGFISIDCESQSAMSGYIISLQLNQTTLSFNSNHTTPFQRGAIQ